MMRTVLCRVRIKAPAGRRWVGGDVEEVEPGLALLTGELGGADRPGELLVAGPVAGDQPDALAVDEVELGADDRMDPGGAGRGDEGDRAVEAVAVAEAEGGQAEVGGGGDQGARRRGSLEEGVVGAHGELGEPG